MKKSRRHQIPGLHRLRRHICRHHHLLLGNAALQNDHFSLQASHFFSKSSPTLPSDGNIDWPESSAFENRMPYSHLLSPWRRRHAELQIHARHRTFVCHAASTTLVTNSSKLCHNSPIPSRNLSPPLRSTAFPSRQVPSRSLPPWALLL